MRFNFDFSDTNTDLRRSITPKEEVEWVPLQNHPAFSASDAVRKVTEAPQNLVAWDGASRLYYWDPNKQCLHRISVRLGEPDPASVIAASPSKVMQADVKLNFEVNRISINRNGSALLLVGSDGLSVMYLYGRTCSSDNRTIVCRTFSVGSQIYFGSSNVIRTLQVSWHPYSDSHLGILSSDSVLRLFNLASDILQPEQEYYLQPVEPGRSRNAASICPVDFCFGGDHLWDRFSVFILFTDGSIYILCPVVPFGSVYKWDSILELYSDAQTYGSRSFNSSAISNSNLAISWLEATFTEVAQDTIDEGNLPTLKAHPHALFNSSVSLQGPLRKICHGGEDKSLAVRGAECEGRAVSFLYDLVSKDSIVVTAWSGGQLQIDALADEIQPVWTVDNPPRLRVDAQDHIRGLAMICEPISSEIPTVKLDQPLDDTVWVGHPPPLLRLATVDLALPGKPGSGYIITMSVDPLMQERIYAVHDGGIDSIVLHFLPFTSQTSGKDEINRSPSVHPVLNTCQGETLSPSPLCGFVSLSDSFGYSWIVGVSSSQECVVIEMKIWSLLLPIQIDSQKELVDSGANKTIDTPDIISKELLTGPNVALLPHSPPNLHAVAADSIEGRSALHQYFKLFHENYVEYAHKVHFELMHHAPQVKRIIDDQHARLSEAQEKILYVEEKQSRLEERIDNAVQRHNSLEQRLRHLKNLPGAQKKPLSRAEREFKSELDQFAGVELDALHSSIEALRARLRRLTQSTKDSPGNRQRQTLGKNYVHDAQVSQLRSSIEKLSLVNSENSKKVKLLESTLKKQESSRS